VEENIFLSHVAIVRDDFVHIFLNIVCCCCYILLSFGQILQQEERYLV